MSQFSNPIKLSQLSTLITDAIEVAFRNKSYWVIADVTNHSYKEAKNFHNFDLVEKDGNSHAIVAKIAGKAWGTSAVKIKDFENVTGQRFTNNIQVLILVSIEYHAQYGLSVTLLNIDPNFTLGLLEQQRKATLEMLVLRNKFIKKIGDGYLTDNNELRLNPVLQRIALISSSISAGSEDFRHTLDNNDYGYTYQVDDYFAGVQGEKNVQQFVDKLVAVYNSGVAYDAVVIVRGGGAQTDFLIFDNYRIARTVAKFPIPIITGIGHQKNETLTDLMVHTQTKTPTKAAEFIIAYNRNFEEKMVTFQKNVVMRSQQLIAVAQQKLTVLNYGVIESSRNSSARQKDRLITLNHKIAERAKSIIFSQQKKLLQISAILTVRPQLLLKDRKNEIKNIEKNIKIYTDACLKEQDEKLANFETAIRIMSPGNILKKGYAIIMKSDKIVYNAGSLEPGDDIDVVFYDNIIRSTIKEKNGYNGRGNDL
ncbi:exodeoxyribonuclease VII large subunit [Flavobacterium subsaxonicum]|uniref:Exodeoxyribonuclease 7 large subunit n=1 Tax=Flavobacterium subsaxonicum WB 4.1-42 = DSM 21790 TaxID=1121898 RepID=A0A0A2MQ10_9FLAO|nr:exodeoxyribonuclease VII large subunit [Flavobacterium subsaxonicum]KGO93641.1 exodeoxyribonuclease VII [Flavobacterium subsaxonicum WB 4.1-42 = DSM 21790]